MRSVFLVLLCLCVLQSKAQNLLHIPDTLSGTSFMLQVHPDSMSIWPGPLSNTFGINGSHYLGPTLLLRKGDNISITVDNQMGDTTSMHWHGLHVSAANDGGPHSMIMPGETWTPTFTVMNKAATYWYHSHMMAKTAEQAIKGDAGLIIVRDEEEAAIALPRIYGVDDFPIIVQSFELDSNNQFMPKGMVDSIVLVNGTDSPYVNMPAQVVRMRLLNASGERTFNFGFTDNRSFSVIASDNGLLNASVTTTRVRMSPGERYEILLNLSGLEGQTIYLMSYASELPMGIQGGPTMPMPPGSPAMNSPLNGIDFNILQINVTAATSGAITAIPTTLANDTPISASSTGINYMIEMTADSMMVMDGPFYFNHNLFDMMRIDRYIQINSTEIWTLHDSTMVAHPFHLHDVHFYILDRNGNPPPPIERGRKDVVLIEPNETVRIAAKFTDFEDTVIPYMFHCHILMHEDDGMMGQFIVRIIPDVVAGVAGNMFRYYPNPVHDNFTIETNANKYSNSMSYKVVDLLGRTITVEASIMDNKLTLNTALLNAGLYTVLLTENGVTTPIKMVK